MVSFILTNKNNAVRKYKLQKCHLLSYLRYPDNYSTTDANFDCNQDPTSQTLHVGVSPDII